MSDIRRNIRLCYGDGIFFSVMTALTTPYVVVYALYLGASDWAVGLLTSLPGIVLLISQGIAVRLSETLPLMIVTLRTAFIQRIFYFGYAALTFLPLSWGSLRAWIFVAGLSLASAPGAIAGVAWTTMIGDAFPAEQRGQIFGRRNMFMTVTIMTLTPLAGFWIERGPFWRFSASYVMAGIFLLGSLVWMSRMDIPSAKVKHLPEKISPGERHKRFDINAKVQNFLGIIDKLWNAKSFRYFALAVFVYQIGGQMLGAIQTLYLVRNINTPVHWLGWYAMLGNLASILMYPFWGKWTDMQGSQAVLRYSTIGAILYPLGFMTWREPWGIAILAFWFGGMAAGLTLATFTRLYEVAPQEHRALFIAANAMVTSLAQFVGPLIGIALYHWQVNSIFVAVALCYAGTVFLFSR